MAVTNFIWDEVSDNVLLETDDSDAVTAAYVNRPEQFGELLSQDRSGTKSFFHYDGESSTSALTDENEDITDTFIYTAYGEEVARAGTTTNPFGYKGAVGYYTDESTSDIYVRNRTFEPAIGRWLSADPIGFVDGSSLYRAYFVPNTVDPTGTRCCIESLDIVISGAITFGLAMSDYYPPFKWDPYWGAKMDKRAGAFENRRISDLADEEDGIIKQAPTWIGHNVQFLGPFTGDNHKDCRAIQTFTRGLVVLTAAGVVQTIDSGVDFNGAGYSDTLKRPLDSYNKPFRIVVGQVITFADPPAITVFGPGVVPRTLRRLVIFETCVLSGDDGPPPVSYDLHGCPEKCRFKICCVRWEQDLWVDRMGRVKNQSLLVRKKYCE